MYIHPEYGAIPHQFKEKLLISAQGGLFTVQTRSLTKRQGKTTCAGDKQTWLMAITSARRAMGQALTGCGFLSPALSADLMIRDTRLGERLIQSVYEQDRAGQEKRGRIVEFSKRSRGRLLRVGARLKQNCYGLMLTFTYRENMRDHQRAKSDLERLSKWLKYHHPEGAYIWRLEYQERGAIHFHILALNVRFIDANQLTAYWQKLTNDDSFPDVKRIRSRRRVMMYISKYIAKMDQAGSPAGDSGFINVPNSENFVGRFWGIVNRIRLPLAPLHLIAVYGEPTMFLNLRRYARKKWRSMPKRLQGFTLFVQNSDQWMRLVEFELMRIT